MLFLVVLGGAAVLEVHRALHNGNSDVKQLREREATLRKQLQDIQRDLQAAKQQRELTESEAAQLSAINQRLSAENEALSAAASSLRAENAELAARADGLLERQQQLEACAESLKLENTNLIQQFDRLKLKYEQENSAFQEQLAGLKEAVGGVLTRFTTGDISADQLVQFLAQMGVELRGRKEDLESLPAQLNSARSTDERLKVLDRVEVEVSDSWLHQMRLITAEPDRAARLLMAGAAAARSSSGPAALLEGPQASSAGAGEATASNAALPFSPPKKLPTPPKERSAAQLPSVKVPPLKLASIAAGGAAAPAAADENAAANVLAAAPAAAAKAEKAGGKTKPAGGLRFLPGKKAAKKQAAPLSSNPQLGLDVPLGQGSSASAMPRLPFDAVNDDLDMPGSRSVMAL